MGSVPVPSTLQRNSPARSTAERNDAPRTALRGFSSSELLALLAWAGIVLVVGALIASTLAAPADAAGVANGAAGPGSNAERASIAVDGTAEYAAGSATTPMSDGAVATAASDGPSGLVAAIDVVPAESLVLFGAFSRYADESTLDHPVRADIDDVVSRQPGLHLAAVVRQVDSPEGTVRYHTRVLERGEHLQTATVWDTLRLYPSGTASDDFELLAALRDDARSRVLEAVAGIEPATVSAIADRVDRAPSTVSHHLSRLDDAQLVVRERSGQSVLVSLDADVRQRLDAGPLADSSVGASISTERTGD